MHAPIKLNSIKSKSIVARVATRKDISRDDRVQIETIFGTKKLVFRAFLCPAYEASIPAIKESMLAFQFGLTRPAAPPEMFRQETTHERDILSMVSQIGFVRFRFGQSCGALKADFINLDLHAGKYSWTDELLRTYAKEVGKQLQSMGVSIVGGFNELYSHIQNGNDMAPFRRLFSIVKEEFACLLPIKDETIFTVPGKDEMQL